MCHIWNLIIKLIEKKSGFLAKSPENRIGKPFFRGQIFFKSGQMPKYFWANRAKIAFFIEFFRNFINFLHATNGTRIFKISKILQKAQKKWPNGQIFFKSGQRFFLKIPPFSPQNWQNKEDQIAPIPFICPYFSFSF